MLDDEQDNISVADESGIETSPAFLETPLSNVLD